MIAFNSIEAGTSREQLVHALYEAAELEHCLMCTYLYAAFSIKQTEADGLTAEQAAATRRWRRTILDVATEEMGHLAAVWNITAALGGAPRFGRVNFPLEIGYLPAGVVVKLAPFNVETMQHFVYLERPIDSDEHDGDGFAPETRFTRGADGPRLTPMAMDYDTVGVFYEVMGHGLQHLVEQIGEDATFCGDPALQLGPECGLPGIARVRCLKTAIAALDAIVTQGEGSRADTANSHYQKFVAIRSEYAALLKADPDFVPAFPAATNPVLRRPPRPEGRVWLEEPRAIATVDLANSAYQLMLRLLAYAYALTDAHAEKNIAIQLAVGLMHAMAPLAELAARLPAGPSNPHCNAGMSFTTLRDAASLPPGAGAIRFFRERLNELANAAARLDQDSDARAAMAHQILQNLSERAARGFEASTIAEKVEKIAPPTPTPATSEAVIENGIERIATDEVELRYEGKRCIHARFCVTGAPTVFLANVQGPWLHPETTTVEHLVEVAHACPSGAIRYARRDGKPDEAAPPVNLAAVREGGPYAFRGDLRIDGVPSGFRATLCRCGASKNKPFCDGSHHDVAFSASGEPATGNDTAMLAQRDGALTIDPQINGPYLVNGNLEIVSGTGRMVSRITTARLCRCGGSANKPFCDGTHAKIGFQAP